MARPVVLITGGFGFVGRALIDALRGTYEVAVLDWAIAPEKGAQDDRIDVYAGDIADWSTWGAIAPADYVVHAAAQVSAVASEEDPLRDFLTNVNGTFCVAEYARRHGAKVIYCNSIRVYDPDAMLAAIEESGCVSEACATVATSITPQPPFAVSKLMGEDYLRYYARTYGLELISHRMGGIVGPGQAGSARHGWLSHLVECAVRGRDFTIFGDGEHERDVLHIADLVDLIAQELRDFSAFAAPGGAIYNVGGGSQNALTIMRVIRLLEDEHGLRLRYSHDSPRLADPRRYVSDISRIAGKGWRPRHAEPKALVAELVATHRQQVVPSSPRSPSP